MSVPPRRTRTRPPRVERYAGVATVAWVLWGGLCPEALSADSGNTAQTRPSAATSAPGHDLPGQALLGEAYVDRNFGYSIRPPADFAGNFRKVPVAEGGLQLAQFVSVAQEAWLTVRYAQADREITQAEMLDGLKIEAVGTRRNAKVHRVESTRICGRPAAVCEVTYDVDDKHFVRHQAVIRFQPDEVFVVVFNTTLADLGAVRSTFDAVLGSFELPGSEVSRKALSEAMQQGVEWLSDVRTRDLSAVLSKEPLYWRYERKGKPIGFLRVYEQPRVQDGISGVQIRERAWLFGEQQSYQDIQNTMFLSQDLRAESWENLTQSRAEVAGKTQLIHDLNKAVRGDNRLALSFTEQPGDLALTSAVRTVPTSYVPMALLRLFPRLVDLNQPRSYAFSAYHVESREMVIRVLKVIGRGTAPGISSSGPVFKLEDNEGLLPPTTMMYADEKGRILRVEQGDLTLAACTRQEVDTLFKREMAMADALYQKSMAQQERALKALMSPAAGAGEKKQDEKRREKRGR